MEILLIRRVQARKKASIRDVCTVRSKPGAWGDGWVGKVLTLQA